MNKELLPIEKQIINEAYVALSDDMVYNREVVDLAYKVRGIEEVIDLLAMNNKTIPTLIALQDDCDTVLPSATINEFVRSFMKTTSVKKGESVVLIERPIKD